MRVLALGFDLFFRPRLDAAASSMGAEVVTARGGPEEAAAAARDVDRVVVDVSAPGALDALRAVRAARPDVPVVACYPHVEAKLAEEAQGLGAQTVTRGAFNGDLARWFGPA